MNPKIANAERPAPPAIITIGKYGDHINSESMSAISRATREYTGVVHKSHASRDRFADISTNISVRNEFNRKDYEYFRPSESIPTLHSNIISACMEAYRKIGIIRNVIDLMADFGTQGIMLVHSNPTIQKIYQEWFYAVSGPERSERFLNMLYKAGNIVCKRSMARLNENQSRMLKTMAALPDLKPDINIIEIPDPQKMVIPWKYNFLNPSSVEIAGGELSQFAGRQIYLLKVTFRLRNMVSFPKNDYEKELVAELPKDIVQKIKSGASAILLPQEKLRVFHYKKDDWQEWADPMLYSILDDLILLEKMKLADLAALDGAISQIRLWTLGDIEHGFWPNDAAISRLTDILLSNPGGGAFDVIWGPDLKVTELRSDVHHFLGKTKYEPCLENIYAGLGVPPTLTGSQNAAGTTNNYVSLKTLVQRLEYGRRLLIQFWDQEIELFRKAMSFRLPAKIRFDRMVLSDEAAEKALLIQMWDRNLVSDDTILERFGEDAGLELLRNRRENRERMSGKRLNKASPYHVEDKQYELKKSALQRTLISPKQSGIEDIPEDYDKNPFLDGLEYQKKMSAQKGGQQSNTNIKGKSGRPKNSGDSYQRTRKDKPRMATGFAEIMVWAKDAQEKINDIIMPGLLQRYGKKNMRQLSAKQFDESEYIKFMVLANLEPFTEVDTQIVYKVVGSDTILPVSFKELYKKFYDDLQNRYHRQPSAAEVRILQLTTYSIIKGELSNGED